MWQAIGRLVGLGANTPRLPVSASAVSAALACVHLFAPTALAQDLSVETLEHGAWPDTVAALQRQVDSEGTVVHVIVTDSSHSRATCGSYDLDFDESETTAFRVLGCDPATQATAVELVSRHALFDHGGPVPRPRQIRLVATEVRVGESTGGAAESGGSELTCSVALRPYLDDLEHGTHVYLTRDRYFVRPLATDVSVDDAEHGWVLRSGPRSSLRIDYEVVERATGEVVLHDHAEMSCQDAGGTQPGATQAGTTSSVAGDTASESASTAPAAPEPEETPTPVGSVFDEAWFWVLVSVALVVIGVGVGVGVTHPKRPPVDGSNGHVVMTLVEFP